MNTVETLRDILASEEPYGDKLRMLGLLLDETAQLRPTEEPYILVIMKEGSVWVQLSVTRDGLYEIANGPAPRDGRVFHIPLRLSARYLDFISRFGLQPKTSINPPPKS